MKHRGHVIEHIDCFEAVDVEFRVSKASQKRARQEQRRNVHAYIVCDEYYKRDPEEIDEQWLTPIYYHPLQTKSFVIANTKTPVREASIVFGKDGKAFVEA